MDRSIARPTRTIAAAALAGVVAASPAVAQGPGTFDLFASRRQASTEPLLGGISFAGYSGPFGIRVSGGLHFGDVAGSGTTASGSVASLDYRGGDRGGCGPRRCGPGGGFGGQARYGSAGSIIPGVGAWATDADLVFAPLRAIPIAKALLLGFSPYAFVGIGATGTTPSNGLDSTSTGWSYGVGAAHHLLGAMGVSAEARYRRAFGGDSIFASPDRSKIEYRAGVTFNFGGGHHRASRPSDVGPTVRPASAATDDASDAAPVAVASRVLDLADEYVGTPYAERGSSPGDGFDAPGFVRFVFGRQGVRLPRTVDEMADVGTPVSTRVGSLRPGDLVFFASSGNDVDDVGIYAGRDRVIHAVPGAGVRYDVLGEGTRGRRMAAQLVGARRVSAASLPDDGN